jgi:serine/threonine protein kinase
MAAVWKVRHTALGTYRALKVLELRSPTIDRRFELEGRLQAKIHHAHVVRVEDVVLAVGGPALLLEYVDGVPLDLLLARGIPTIPEALGIFRGIALAVAAAHAAGAVHRDLKPGNVMMEIAQRGLIPRVTDFGLAKVTDDNSVGARRTRTNTALGTPEYMAHEQLGDASRVGPAADIFALGVILFELVIGDVPWVGADMASQVRARAAGPAPDPGSIRPDIPPAAIEVLRSALRENPAERPASVVEMIKKLYGSTESPAPPVRGPLHDLAKKLRVVAPTIANDPATNDPPPERITPALPARRPRWGARALVFAGVLAAGCGSFSIGFMGMIAWKLGGEPESPLSPAPLSVAIPTPTAEGALFSSEGADEAWLESGGNRFLPGARVPPGAYRVFAVFGGRTPIPAGEVVIPEGATEIAVHCAAGSATCTAQ